MQHIRQKNSSYEVDKSYTVVLPIQGVELSEHPCLIEQAQIFELVDTNIPSDAQYLKYQ